MDAKMLIESVVRQRSWLFGRYSAHKALNLASAAKDFAFKRETMKALLTIVKIEISRSATCAAPPASTPMRTATPSSRRRSSSRSTA